jgi:mono/diheme cytochrome c family protein
MRMQCLLVAVFIATGTSTAVRAQESGDPESGLTVARQNCASCHAVEGSGPSPVPDAPTFATIAAVPGMTTAALMASLHTSHSERTMPHLVLSPDDLRNVVAYILSLNRN